MICTLDIHVRLFVVLNFLYKLYAYTADTIHVIFSFKFVDVILFIWVIEMYILFIYLIEMHSLVAL